MNNFFAEPLIFLAGPTAIGKTELALNIAKQFNCEIIGVDSMQIYRYMDIGTAKPSMAERDTVPHHLIDYVKPDEPYNAARFVRDCKNAIIKIRKRGRVPLLTGGTGLYFTALQDGIFAMPEIDPAVKNKINAELAEPDGRKNLYNKLKECDPASAARIHINDTYRLSRALEIYRGTGNTWSALISDHKNKLQEARSTQKILKISLVRPRDELYTRINKRVGIMIESGLLNEVEGLIGMGYGRELKSMQSLGYRHIINFIDNIWSWQKTTDLLAQDTRHYAKRQLTWFGADKEMICLHPDSKDKVLGRIEDFLFG